MTLAYKLLNHNGTSTKGGDKTWPLPNGNEPGHWMSTIHGISEYYLCKRDNLCLWIDYELFVAEFNDIIEEDNNDIKVPDARLVVKINSWNNHTQKNFMRTCCERILSEKDSIDPDKEQYVDLMQAAYDANNLIGVSRFATQIAIDDTEELNRQNNLIWEFVREEIMSNFSQDAFA